MAARMLLASLEAAAQPAAILKAGSVLLQHCLSQDLSQVRNGLFFTLPLLRTSGSAVVNVGEKLHVRSLGCKAEAWCRKIQAMWHSIKAVQCHTSSKEILTACVFCPGECHREAASGRAAGPVHA